jgi:hypothetical protein
MHRLHQVFEGLIHGHVHRNCLVISLGLAFPDSPNMRSACRVFIINYTYNIFL